MNKKAVVLLSGGLDSILATHLMLEQGIEVAAVHYYIEFAACGGGGDYAKRCAAACGINLAIVDITAEYLDVFTKPKHGYGANINPCIDCKIFMLQKAREYMEHIGASFLVTGEVLGERPMSQRRDALNIIERDAGIRGILLRPLSAKLLPPTIPETEGLVDREKLLDISGRSRKPQIELAKRFGITDYPNPAGGCLLTDPGFTRRVKDLMSHGTLKIADLRLLAVGRHFRLSPSAKLVVGRDQQENDAIQSLAQADDTCLKLKTKQGPFSLVRGAADEATIERAASLAAHHTKFKDADAIEVSVWKEGAPERTTVTVVPADRETVEKMRL